MQQIPAPRDSPSDQRGHQNSARHPRSSPGTYRKGRRSSAANANAHPNAHAPQAPPAPPRHHDCEPPLPFDLSDRPQHSFVSDTSRVTSKLFDALGSNRVGVCDAHLHTKENLCVPVSRSILTALNSYLVDYACPNTHTATNCSAAQAKQVPISSRQLQHILEFIYTDDCSFVRNVRSSVLWRKDNDVPHTAIVDVIQLAQAAHICHTPDLSTWCEKTALAMVRHRPNFLCSAMNTIMNFPTTNADRLVDLWMRRVFEQPASFLGPMQKESTPLEAHATKEELRCSVLELDANTFATILKSCHGNDEYFFRAVYCWATRGYTELSKAGPRWRNAVKLARRIDFTNVSSKFLLGFVDSSGLVDQEDMAAIYRSHLAAKSNLPPSYGLQRTNEKSLKRKNDTNSHAADAAQKKQRIDPGQGAELKQHVQHMSPRIPAAQGDRRKHHPQPTANDALEDDDNSTNVLPPMSSNPRNQSQSRVTASEHSVPASSTRTSSLIHNAGEGDHNVMHSCDRQRTWSEHPPQTEDSQAARQSGGVSSQEQPPPAPAPAPAKHLTHDVAGINGAGCPTDQMQGEPQRSGSISTEVKEEVFEQTVKEEFNIIEV
ncbi:SKP1/BTB/POZ [Gracilaria domingensis]|nr:SKP1/BTB/POZ [Gracilaria domingensis]